MKYGYLHSTVSFPATLNFDTFGQGLTSDAFVLWVVFKGFAGWSQRLCSYSYMLIWGGGIWWWWGGGDLCVHCA